MRVTRSYWLGLGSGLILSAILTLIIQPYQGPAITPHESSSSPAIKQPVTLPLEETKQPNLPPITQPSQGDPSNAIESTQIEQVFNIPKGSSSEQIASLLLDQGLIKDKASFLENVHQMGVESKFRAGTYRLSVVLTTEELINRLLKR